MNYMRPSKMIALAACLFHLIPTASLAAIATTPASAPTTFNKAVTINDVKFTGIDLDSTLLEQYIVATAKTRTLNTKQFQVTVTLGKTTKTFTSLKAVQSYVLGKDKGLSFINGLSNYVVIANDAAKWTLKDEFFSDQLEKYDNVDTLATSELFEEYAESLMAEKLDIEMMQVQSAEEAMQSIEEMYQEIFTSASNQYGGGTASLILALLGCPDSGGTGCAFDKDCDGTKDSADSHPDDPNRQTDFNDDGENDFDSSIIWSSEGGGTYGLVEFYQMLGVTNIYFLNMIDIYDTYQIEMLTNMTVLQTRFTQLFQKH